MATCAACGEEIDEFVVLKINGKKKKMCEDCAEDAEAEAQIAEESEAVVQEMMGFKGRR
jgi:hypothetical protein